MNDRSGGYDDFQIYPIPQAALPSTNEGADFNLDGFIDIAVGNSRSTTISIWRGDGAGGIAHVQNAPADEQVRGLCVLDLNGDGYFDIVTANRLAGENEGNLSVLLNDGNGQFPSSVNIETDSHGETACATADANDDGLLDVFIGAHFSDEVVLFLADGTGGLTFADKTPVNENPWMITAGDVNGDGFADAVSVESTGNSMSVVLSDGRGGLLDAVSYTTGQFPIAIDLGDLDGDGDLDAVASSFSEGEYVVFENNGLGVFAERLSLPAATAASCAVLHDRDNDGDLDISGIDELADRLFLFENSAVDTALETVDRPKRHGVGSVYPNPFREEARIVFRLANPSHVRVTVHDVLGREVLTLFDASVGTGRHVILWDGLQREAPAGVYWVSVVTPAMSWEYRVVKLD